MIAVKQKMTFALCLSVVSACMLIAASLAAGLPYDDDKDGDPFLAERGLRVVGIKGIGQPGQEMPFPAWSFPTTIVVNSTAYSVNGNSDNGFFRMFSSTNSQSQILEGYVSRFRNTRNALIRGLGGLAINNLNVWSAAEAINVSQFAAGSNLVFYASCRGGKADAVLICRNMFIQLESEYVTNKLDFAMSLLNAGLPESERMPPLQPQS